MHLPEVYDLHRGISNERFAVFIHVQEHLPPNFTGFRNIAFFNQHPMHQLLDRKEYSRFLPPFSFNVYPLMQWINQIPFAVTVQGVGNVIPA